jgi:hypothetical protein
MVVGRSQIRAVRWMRQDSTPKLCDGLLGMYTCVWPRIVMVKKHFCHLYGDEPSGNASSGFPHRRSS